MENATSKNSKIELIQTAIQQLIEFKQTHLHNKINDDEHHKLLNILISQLEALKADGVIDPSPEPQDAPSCKASEPKTEGIDQAETSNCNTTAETEDVIKELKKLEKQNKITHWLLSALILLVVAWQFSEVTLLMKLKHKITNPFQSIGNMFKGIVKRPRSNQQEQDQEQSLFATEHGNESLLKLPQLELPGLVINDEKK